MIGIDRLYTGGKSVMKGDILAEVTFTLMMIILSLLKIKISQTLTGLYKRNVFKSCISCFCTDMFGKYHLSALKKGAKQKAKTFFHTGVVNPLSNSPLLGLFLTKLVLLCWEVKHIRIFPTFRLLSPETCLG